MDYLNTRSSTKKTTASSRYFIGENNWLGNKKFRNQVVSYKNIL
jgi:hypothetical protein